MNEKRHRLFRDNSFLLSLLRAITNRRYVGFILTWLIIAVLFISLYVVARRVVVNEIRFHARGVAIATAAGIDFHDLDQIHSPADASKEPYKRVQRFLNGISLFNPDVRYIYAMRRQMRPTAKPADYEFIVDQAARDVNNNGVIDEDEICEQPGKPYDAVPFPELMNAWEHATADLDVSPDPPYPDLMTGYAPIKNEKAETVAVVGVDITAATIHRKLRAIRIVVMVSGLILGILGTLITKLAYQQRFFLIERDGLISQLQNALAHVKTLHGLLPICAACKKVRTDSGYWEQIEKYIGDHSDAVFTHSICPDCAKKLYGDIHNPHS